MDLEQLTQLSKDECVNIISLEGDWAFVECEAQSMFHSVNGWSGYKGWLPLQALDLCAKKPKKIPLSPPSVAALIQSARKFIGSPYLWGGRSDFNPENRKVATGVDCSGLTSLCFQRQGVELPRDAHDQFLVALPILKEEVRPGDLVFLSSNGERMTHVMLAVDKDVVIEATWTHRIVREVLLQEKLKESRPKMVSYGRVLL